MKKILLSLMLMLSMYLPAAELPTSLDAQNIEFASRGLADNYKK